MVTMLRWLSRRSVVAAWPNKAGPMPKLQRLLESGAAINGRDQHGWTALHRASFKGRIDAVRALLEKGINVDAKDEDGYTALHCAVESGHDDVTEVLVKKGSDVEARTNKGVTALQIAESLRYVGIARLLISGGASRENMDQTSELELTVIPFGSKMENVGMKRKKMNRTRRVKGSFKDVYFCPGFTKFLAPLLAAVTMIYNNDHR